MRLRRKEAFRLSWQGPSGREVSNTGIILVGVVGALASASRVGCDLKAIPTQLHPAPASRPLLADVMEMQHALGTLADALAIHSRE